MSLAQRSAAILQHGEPLKKRRKSTLKVKPSMIAVYASVFLLVVAIISIGYQKPESSTTVANATNIAVSSQIDEVSVNDEIASSVAASIAQVSNLPIANSVSNMAVSIQTMASTSQTEGAATTKPQIIESVTESRLVQNYVTQSGDNVPSLAAKFGITAQTIKWANNLTSDAVSIGSTLKILPINGVLYTVKAGDSIDSLAGKYKIDATRLVTYNDLEVSGLVPNTNIILPDGILPEDERPGYVPPIVYNYYYSTGTGFGGDTWFIHYGTGLCPTYAFGNCTCYAYTRRVELGLGVGPNWGHATSWASNAANDGYVVDHEPSIGAIMQNSGGYGHVAIVESIAANGDLTISEMNASVAGGGYNIVSGRTILAGNAEQYWYIH